MDQLTVQN